MKTFVCIFPDVMRLLIPNMDSFLTDQNFMTYEHKKEIFPENQLKTAAELFHLES